VQHASAQAAGSLPTPREQPPAGRDHAGAPSVIKNTDHSYLIPVAIRFSGNREYAR
jgi:hypothetical protein